MMSCFRAIFLFALSLCIANGAAAQSANVNSHSVTYQAPVGECPLLFAQMLRQSAGTPIARTPTASDRTQKLADFIKKVHTAGKQNRDLDFASTLTLEERYQVAASITGQPLTDVQMAALKKAHEAGGYDFDPNSPLTKLKDKILTEGGFTSRQSAILRGNGIAGEWDDNARYGFTGQTAKFARSNGSITKARIVGIAEHDDYGNPTHVYVGWEENGQHMSKTVSLAKMQIDYMPGQKIFFKRSNGSYTYGTISYANLDPATGDMKYTVTWSENGNDMLKNVDAADSSHINPAAPNAGEGQAPPWSSEPPPRREPPPRPPPPQSIWDKAASVVPSADNNINFTADRDEMMRIVQSKNKVSSLRSIQEHLRIPGNPSVAELKMEVRRKLQKYHEDRNRDYRPVAKETTDALNDMMNLIKTSERSVEAQP